MAQFSKRSNWQRLPNEWSTILARKRAQGAKLYDLTASNPTEARFSFYDSDLMTPFGSPDNLLYHPDPQGHLAARQAVADYYRKKRRVEIPAENVFLTPGTSDAYQFLFRLLTNPGDEVLCAAPGYPLFDVLADINDITVKKFELKPASGRWTVDWISFVGALTDRTKIVLVVHPNNPTGQYWSATEKQKIEAICAQRNLALIVDEVFWDYTWDPKRTHVHFTNTVPDVLKFTLSGISKILALPQMKLSWITLHGPEKEIDEALERLRMIGDAYLSVSTPVQNALPQWLPKVDTIQEEIKSRVLQNKEMVGELIPKELGVLCWAEGGWYGVLELAEGLEDEILALDLLAQKNVLIHPGYLFDFIGKEYVVLSLLAHPETFEEGIKRMRQYISK